MCCTLLCATDWKSVVRVVWLFVRRTGSLSYVLCGSLYDGLEVRRTCCMTLCTTDWKSVVRASALGWRGRRGRWANAAELLAANKDEQDIRPAATIDHGLRQLVNELTIGKLHSATQRIAGQFMCELP